MGYRRNRLLRRGLFAGVFGVLVFSLAATASQGAGSGGRPSCLGSSATIVGTAQADRLIGTSKADVIVALGGGDYIAGRGGDDLICAGGGDDRVLAGGGADRVSGGAGDDELYGGNGDDELAGGADVDSCRGGAGDNSLRGCERRPSRGANELESLPPRAHYDTGSVVEDAQATAIDVLANDTDVDGGPKRVASVTQAAHGTVAITGGGTGLSYTPAANYCGQDSFTYTLNGGSSASVSIEVACVDDPPVAVNDSAGFTEDAQATAIDVLANDTDVDGGPKRVASVTQGAHGTVAITGGGTGLTYAPAANYCGQDSFTYALNGGSSASVSIEVACVDDPPVAVDDSAEFTEDDSATAIDVLQNDTDIDGGPKKIESATQGAHGSVAITGGGTGLTYTPAANYCGQDSFTYTLAPGGSSASVSIEVTCVDDPPVAVEDSAEFTEDDSATAIDVLANDTDIDAGPKAVAQVTQPAHGAVAIAESGAGLTYAPEAGYCSESSSDEFTYTLNGGSSATVSVGVACLETDPSVVELSTTPGLFPLAFDRTVDDYAIKCLGAPVEVSASVAPGYSVSIDGAAPATGTVQATVPLGENQEFEVTVFRADGSHRYYVRCLPSDFPAWEYTQLKKPSHEDYVVVPTLGASSGRYVVIFDGHGVPVWWYQTAATPYDAKVLPDGKIGWTRDPTTIEIRDLDGTLDRSIQHTGDLSPDIHELQELPNGNLILIAYSVRQHVDLTAFGGGPDDSVYDGVIQEVDPQGNVVWEWNTKDHITLAETGRWYALAASHASEGRDIVHMNAVEPDGENAVLISLRHTDAVYKIDKTTGEVIWKLGGTPTPQSLTVLDDPFGAYPFGGQHDVRLQPDGTITVHDNNSELGLPPRAVRYEIDEADHTAKLLEEVTDPLAPSSYCCGSARRSADGSWLMSWGSRSLVTEFNAAGERTFRLEFGGTLFSYRAVSVPDGLLSPGQFRAGMDSMHPR